VTRLPGERLDRRPAAAGAPADRADPADAAPLVGVLALQGDVLEHTRALRAVGVRPLPVRSVADLEAVDGLVLPGGESTAISRALGRAGLDEPLARRIADGLPVLGTCAGLILLSDELVEDDALPRPGGIAVRTRRNAYGPQTASFDVRVEVAGLDGGPMDVAFIRAPRIEAVLGDAVDVLAEVDGAPVAVQQGARIGLAFHPEVTGDLRLHARLADLVRRRTAR